MLTHAELKAKALQKPAVRIEYERLNRENQWGQSRLKFHKLR